MKENAWSSSPAALTGYFRACPSTNRPSDTATQRAYRETVATMFAGHIQCSGRLTRCATGDYMMNNEPLSRPDSWTKLRTPEPLSIDSVLTVEGRHGCYRHKHYSINTGTDHGGTLILTRGTTSLTGTACCESWLHLQAFEHARSPPFLVHPQAQHCRIVDPCCRGRLFPSPRLQCRLEAVVYMPGRQ